MSALTGARPDRALQRSFVGELLAPGDPGYDAARRVWALEVDRRPALIARCTCTGDVAAAVRFARERDLAICVRSGGGHSYAGHGVWDGALMIDLSPMKALAIDAQARTATVRPGVTWAELGAASQAFGLATTGAEVGSVGVAGMTLGGGLGRLQRIHGLTSDNLLCAEVVLADGRVVNAGIDEHPDLFWGLRGAGWNFGVATSLKLRLHPLGRFVGGVTVHSFERTLEVLNLYRELSLAADEKLSLEVLLITAPPARWIPRELHGRPVAMLGAAYFGSLADGEKALQPVRELGPPVVDRTGPMVYADLQHPIPTGLHHCGRSELLSGLNDSVCEALVDGVACSRSPFTLVTLNQLGGNSARGEGCFAYRDAAHTVGIHSMWRPDQDPGSHTAWARKVLRAVLPCSAGGAYVNQLDDEGHERVRAAYGRHYDQLAAIKAIYDPDNALRINQNIPPSNRDSVTPPGLGLPDRSRETHTTRESPFRPKPVDTRYA